MVAATDSVMRTARRHAGDLRTILFELICVLSVQEYRFLVASATGPGFGPHSWRAVFLFRLGPAVIGIIDGQRLCNLCRVGAQILFVNDSRLVDDE